jgi:hypothetical protein
MIIWPGLCPADRHECDTREKLLRAVDHVEPARARRRLNRLDVLGRNGVGERRAVAERAGPAFELGAGDAEGPFGKRSRFPMWSMCMCETMMWSTIVGATSS